MKGITIAVGSRTSFCRGQRQRLAGRLRACLMLAIIAAGPFAMKLPAQNYLTSTGTPTFAAPYPAEMGAVDAASGNLHLEISLGAFPQRATATPLVPKLVYDSHIWVPQFDVTTNSEVWTILGLGMGITAPRTYGTWGFEVGNSSTLIAVSDQYKISNGTVTFCEVDYLLWDTTGTQHYFPIVVTDPSNNCPAGSGSGYAADSSGYYMVTSDTSNLVNVYAPDGTLVFNYWEGYAQNVNPNYPYTVVEDSNGNYLYSNNATETDTLGRVVGTTMVNGYSTPPPTTLPMFNSQDTTTGTSSYSVTTAVIPVKTNFQQSGITDCTSSCTAEIIQSVVLADNSKYTFLYDCDSTTGNSACGSPGGQAGYYGTLTSMTLPTGQTITYGYSNFKDAAGNINRWITSKTTGTTMWSYTPLVTANGGWQRSYSCALVGCRKVTITSC